jgi:hypothetical protein
MSVMGSGQLKGTEGAGDHQVDCTEHELALGLPAVGDIEFVFFHKDGGVDASVRCQGAAVKYIRHLQ